VIVEWDRELMAAVDAARAAGARLEQAFGGDRATLVEKGRDIKLLADREAEAAALEVLLGTGHPVLAEESGELGELDGLFWVVDPLDGTLNFKRGLPISCVSIGLVQGDTPLLGVILDFHRGELFSGVVGQGAWCNGEAIAVSDVAQAERAVLTTGFPTYRDFGDDSLLQFVRDVQRFKKVRLLGSAALSLAWVACGRVDAYAEDDIMLWDVAAGLALVRAAGGEVELEPSARMRWGRSVRCGARASLWR
jgi:myo-inositol-1(or 4)-monophosphatase